jgi:wobble nucleotide-excising tRNase
MFIEIPNKEIEEVVDNIENIDLMIITEPSEILINELYSRFPIKHYKTVVSVNDEKAKIKFLAKEKKEKVDEFIMIALDQTDNNCVVLRLGGSFNLKALEKLADKLDVNEIMKYR